MCLAIAAKAGKRIPDEHLMAGWRGNRDGAGMAYVADGQVIVDKGYMQLDHLLRAYDERFGEHGAASPFLVHFRTATTGKVGPGNTHPFKGNYGAFIHNGVFSGMGDLERSDTAQFADLIRDVPADRIGALISNLRGKLGWSKCAFLTHSGELHFYDESGGNWDNDIWYSNRGYLSGARDYGGRGSVGSHCGIGG